MSVPVCSTTLSRFLRVVVALSLLIVSVEGVFWLRSYHTPEPSTIVIPQQGLVDYGTRQGYVWLAIYEPLPSEVLHGPGSTVIWKRFRFCPGIEREVIDTPYIASTTRVRWWLVAVLTVMPAMLLMPRLAREYGAARRVQDGLCVMCGYDLRASPVKCPECGTARKDGA